MVQTQPGTAADAKPASAPALRKSPEKATAMHSYDALGPDLYAQTDYSFSSIRPDSAAPSQSVKIMTPPRDIVFLSKATPLDDEFALWLAPRLEAAGYKVFCDVLSLEPGDRILSDIMGLTKINYNSCNFNDGLPVTVRFTRMVGEVLTMGSAKGADKQPFKYYI